MASVYIVTDQKAKEQSGCRGKCNFQMPIPSGPIFIRAGQTEAQLSKTKPEGHISLSTITLVNLRQLIDPKMKSFTDEQGGKKRRNIYF